MKKFKYEHLTINCKSSTDNIIIKYLNMWGNSGWEIVNQVGEISPDNGFGRSITFLMKVEIVENALEGANG